MSRSKLGEGVYFRLMRMLTEQRHFAPGQRLIDGTIAEQLAVSRGPVREALQRLEQEGLVESRPGHGFRVREFSTKDIEEIYSLRATLEGFASSRATFRLAQVDFDALERLVNAISERSRQGDTRAVLDADMAFHEKIVASADHQRLLQTWLQLRSQIVLIANFTAIRIRQDLRDIHTRHLMILEALASKDPHKAFDVSQAHVLDALEMLDTRGLL